MESEMKRHEKETLRFQNMPRSERPDAEQVIDQTCFFFDVNRDDLLCGGARKPEKLVKAREGTVHRLRQLTPRLSYPQIAKLMGFQCHTSALYAHRRYLNKANGKG